MQDEIAINSSNRWKMNPLDLNFPIVLEISWFLERTAEVPLWQW